MLHSGLNCDKKCKYCIIIYVSIAGNEYTRNSRRTVGRGVFCAVRFVTYTQYVVK
jgi:hypothetical protein